MLLILDRFADMYIRFCVMYVQKKNITAEAVGHFRDIVIRLL